MLLITIIMSSQPAEDVLDDSDLLTRSWHMNAQEFGDAKDELEKKHLTVSSVAEHYLRSRIDYYSACARKGKGLASTGAASLVSLLIGKINQALAESDDLQSDVATIAKGLNSTTLCEVLRDSRLPYVVLRVFLDLPYETVASNESGTLARLQDIDEAVILNEEYIRTRSLEGNTDGAHLLSIEDLGKVIGHTPSDLETSIVITRMEPPLGGFECLGENRKRTVEICATSQSYCERFDSITKGILRGLDWSHVLLAGNMALATLIYMDESSEANRDIQEGELNIYLYGLDADQANQKVEEIFKVWTSNLPPDNQDTLVVKNVRTIEFIPDYPNRRLRVILRVFDSLTQVLLRFDLDACAIGFDGRRALMLPRCARAIETGYNVFTMNIIYGSFLGERYSRRETRIFDSADRGFGLRILPAYARSLEKGHTTMPSGKVDEATKNHGSHHDDGSEDVRKLSYLPAPCRKYDGRDSYRMPDGPEDGIKTLKRVAYLGQDLASRFYFGTTPLHYPSKKWLEAYPNLYIKDYNARKEHLRKRGEELERLLPEKLNTRLSKANFYDLDGRDSLMDHNTHFSLSAFEVFARHVEAWRMTARRKVS